MFQIAPLLRRFAKDESGVFAVLFGLMAIVLIALGGATVDYVSLEQTRQRAQVALDAAVLALQPDIYRPGVTAEQIRLRAEAIVLERIGNTNILEARVNRVEVDLDTGRLFLAGDFTVPTLFVNLVGVTQLQAGFNAEAVRGAVDIEVAVALDVTGSMAGTRINDLKSALNNLIDSIVQDEQSPNYSKMALIPYAQAVNSGTYATTLRGPVLGSKNISSLTWLSGNTAYIRNITRASTAVVTANGHGFSNGDWVYIWDVTGMTQVNNRGYQVANKTNDTFQLSGTSSSSFSSYRGSGQVRKCDNQNCDIRVTSNGHGFSAGQFLHVTGVGGFTGLNDRTYSVRTVVNTNILTLTGTPGAGTGTYQSNTGQLHCTSQTATAGCPYYYFNTVAGGTNTFPINTCVTERSANGANDQPPSVTLVGRNYAGASNGCPTQTIVPLTDNKTVLRNTANALNASGSTSGSLGTLWAWYMLSPNFGYVWPAGSQPAPYGQQNLLKAAIIMTDGDYNTVHCNGVVARNSGSGSGGTGDQISCDAPNGNSDRQARTYCDAIKARGIVVYTVGFGITAGSSQANLLTYCASNVSNAYLANNGAALASAFAQIARNISSLRLTQ